MKFGCRPVIVTQERADFERAQAYRRRTAAFEEWRKKLRFGDRLPRGRYFKGKSPGLDRILLVDEWNLLNSLPKMPQGGW